MNRVLMDTQITIITYNVDIQIEQKQINQKKLINRKMIDTNKYNNQIRYKQTDIKIFSRSKKLNENTNNICLLIFLINKVLGGN